MSPKARHRCDVSSELCCPAGAHPRRWVPALVTVTCFGVECRTIGHRTTGNQDNWAPGHLGTRTIGHQDNWAPDNWAPGQLGTGQLRTRTTEHQDNWAPGQLGTRTTGHQDKWVRTTGHQDNWAPVKKIQDGPSCPGAQLSRCPVVRKPRRNIASIMKILIGRLAQLLNARYWCGTSEVRFPDRSNRHSVANSSPSLRRFFEAVLPRRLAAKTGPLLVTRFGVMTRFF